MLSQEFHCNFSHPAAEKLPLFYYLPPETQPAAAEDLLSISRLSGAGTEKESAFLRTLSAASFQDQLRILYLLVGRPTF